MSSPQSRSWRRLALAFAAVGLGLLGCLSYVSSEFGNSRALQKFSGTVMGSEYTLILIPNGSFDPAAAHQAACAKLTRTDALMSTYREDSDVSRINCAAPGEWVPVASETLRVIQAARQVGERSEGFYDITLGPLIDLWGFGPHHRPATAPPEAEIEEALKNVGWGGLELQSAPPAVRRLAAGVAVDLSSIAQGFAVDEAAAALELLGVTDYCLDLSGDVRALGRNARGRPWQIAIESPREDRLQAQRVVSVSGMSLTTSGDYRNYFEEAGLRYSHIIDPHTGHPITHRLASVTVVAPSCLHADAWDTALLAAGPDAGLALAEREQLAAFFIVRTRDGFEERQTSRFSLLNPH